MARGEFWQGILDWFRPGRSKEGTVDQADSTPSPAASVSSGTSLSSGPRLSQGAPTPNTSDAGAQILLFPERESRPVVAARRAEFFDSEFAGVAGSDGTLALEDPLVAGVDEAELLDFLAADLDPVPADPVFREKLRDELWSMVTAGSTAPDDDPGRQ